jgi:hypothetical protein
MNGSIKPLNENKNETFQIGLTADGVLHGS